MWLGLHVKYPLFLSGFNESRTVTQQIFDKYSISNFIKLRPVGAELFNVDGRTDMTKLSKFRRKRLKINLGVVILL